MKKAILLILCLLFCTSPVIAQQRNPPPRPRPRSFYEQTLGITRPGTPTEQGREREPTLLERAVERVRAQQHAPSQEQEPVPSPSSVTLSVDFNPTFCIYNCTLPVNVMPSVPAAPKRGVPAVQFEEGLTPDQLAGRASLPPSKGLPKPGEYGAVSIKGDPNGAMFWSEDDSAELDRTVESIHRGAEDIRRIGDSVGLSIEELKRINWASAATNAPPAPRLADHTPSVLPTASAASHTRRTRLRRADGPKDNPVLVRANRNGFPIGTLFEGDVFIATDLDKVSQNAAGDAKGNVQKPGWIRYDSNLKGHRPAQSNPPAPVLTGEKARDYLLDNYAFVINELGSQPSPARITEPTLAYQNYTNGVPLDPLPRQLLPYDPINNPRKFAWRWVTDDGKYVMGRECRIDPASKEKKCVDGAPTYWVYVPVCAVDIPGYAIPCRR